jgi:hypothetical protein
LVGAAVPFIGDIVALVGDVVALVGGPLSGIGGVLRPIQGRGPSGNPGLGCPQRLLGRLSAGLGGLDPGVVDGHGSDPLALGVLDDLACSRSCWNAASGLIPRVPASTPLACSIQTRPTSAFRSWATSISRAASSAPVWIRSAVTAANASSASISCADQARGLVV